MTVAGHVFISYEHGDKSYVDRLAAFLTKEGIPVWYDFSIVPGDRYAEVLQEQLDGSAAVMVVLTPEAAESDWVRKEVNYAVATNRPILPIELRPTKELLQLASLQREDVRGGTMPSSALLQRLRSLLPPAPPPASAPSAPTVVPEAPHDIYPDRLGVSGAPAVQPWRTELADEIESRLSALPHWERGWFGFPRDGVHAALTDLVTRLRRGDAVSADDVGDRLASVLSTTKQRSLVGRGYEPLAVSMLFHDIEAAVRDHET
jgi:hypothetical protein